MRTNALITGASGFCGAAVALSSLRAKFNVVGIDAHTSYYDVRLKNARSCELQRASEYVHIHADLCDRHAIENAIKTHEITHVIHLAAQPGVRHSISHPREYIQANLVGFANVLEACRHAKVKHLIYASSSSVYGANTKTPFSERDSVDHPVSLYAATKKANELMAHSYSHLYGLPTTGLRFFTVYGPWGRPDMAPWLFTDAIMQGKPINVFNNGDLVRDFTYVEDVAECIVRLLDKPPQPNPDYDHANPRADQSDAPYRVLNVGNEQPVKLMDFIHELERALGRKAILNFMPMQPGDVMRTEADVSELRKIIDYAPNTPISVGLAKWAAWYKSYHNIKD
jgi:UDP-glucuronate 4-epimerase